MAGERAQKGIPSGLVGRANENFEFSAGGHNVAVAQDVFAVRNIVALGGFGIGDNFVYQRANPSERLRL